MGMGRDLIFPSEESSASVPALPALPQAVASETAFTALYARMYEKLLHFAKMELRDDDTAADIVQGVFVSIWHQYYRGRDSVGGEESHDGLACQMVKFRISNHKRDRARYRMKLCLRFRDRRKKPTTWPSFSIGVRGHGAM